MTNFQNYSNLFTSLTHIVKACTHDTLEIGSHRKLHADKTRKYKRYMGNNGYSLELLHWLHMCVRSLSFQSEEQSLH